MSCLIVVSIFWAPSFDLRAADGVQPIKHEPEPEPKAPVSKNKDKTTTSNNKTEKSKAAEVTNPTAAKALSTKSPQEVAQADFKHYLPEELKQLTKDTSVLWLEHNSAQYKGVAVLIPDWGQTASSPKQIQQLRNQLTHIGLTTLTLQPPAPQLIEQEEKSQDNLFQTQSDYKQQLLKQMQDIEQEIQAKPGFKLVLSQGVNNGWLAEFYLNEGLINPDAMVLLDAYYPELQSNKLMAMSLSKLMFPLLDVTTRQSNQWQKNQLQDRAMLMQKQIKLDYRQQAMILDTQEQRLFKSIYGWLSSLGWY